MSAVGRTAALIAALGVALCLLGCATRSSSSDDQHHGFYGGLSIGGSHI